MSNHSSNETFVFSGKAKLFTLVLMGLGALCLALSWFSGTEEMHHMRFWSNYLHNSVFFVGIAFTAVLFLSTHTMAWGGWQTIFKRVPEAMMPFLYVGVVLFAILGGAIAAEMPGTELLYLWNNQDYLNPASANYDELADHKSAFVNPTAYLLTALVIAIWSLFAFMFRKLSIKQDSTPHQVTSGNSVPELTKKTRIYAAAFLPIAGFSSAYCIWQWVMSVDTHWYSTLFAWYATVSMWVAMVALVYMIIIYLRSKGHLSKFTDEHTHDLGKYVFGFSVFWTYLWFSQFLLIWYSNNGEETQYFYLRFEQFKPIFFANLLINFVGPFFILMMNSSKRTMGTLAFTAGLVFFGHWLDFYQMIKPGVWYNYEHQMHISHAGHGNEDPGHEGDSHGTDGSHDNHSHEGHGDAHSDATYHLQDGDLETPRAVLTAGGGHAAEVGADDHGDHGHAEAGGIVMGVHIPGFLELGTMLGFLGLFLFVTFTSLGRASLYPKNDPYLLESEHHDTGVGVVKDIH
jgi:hypothetical protein